MSAIEIELYNRHTQCLEEEVVFEKWFMDFFYGTPFGLWLCEHFINKPWFTKLMSRQKHQSKSKNSIEKFITQYNINVDEIRDPIDSFATFNDFFIRELVDGARPIDPHPSHLISPADGRILHYPICSDQVIPVKGTHFDLASLLQNNELTELYNGGDCIVVRLAPADYHRFGYIDSGHHDGHQSINGFLHSVSPYALRHNLKVFTENQRELCVLHTQNFGKVAHIDVGALLVGKIIQHHPQGGRFQKGAQKGYFEFGGSTVILLFEPNTIEVDQDIRDYSQQGIETIVQYGTKIGTKL